MVGRAAMYLQSSLLTCALVAWAPASRADDAFELRGPRVPSPAQTAAQSPALLARRDDRTAPAVQDDDASLLQSPWFWAGIAGVVAAGIAVALVAASPKDEPAVPKGTLNLSVNVLTQTPCGNGSAQR